MCLEEYIDRSLYYTSAIGIFDSKDVLTFIMMRPQIGIESSAKSSNMEISCRRWGKSSTDSHRFLREISYIGYWKTQKKQYEAHAEIT